MVSTLGAKELISPLEPVAYGLIWSQIIYQTYQRCMDTLIQLYKQAWVNPLLPPHLIEVQRNKGTDRERLLFGRSNPLLIFLVQQLLFFFVREDTHEKLRA